MKKKILGMICLIAIAAVLISGCTVNVDSTKKPDSKSSEAPYVITENPRSEFILIQVKKPTIDNSQVLHEGLQELERKGYDIIDWKPNVGARSENSESNVAVSYEVRVKR